MFVPLLCICNERDHAHIGAGFRYSIGKFQVMAGLECIDCTGRFRRSSLPVVAGIHQTGD